MAASEELFGGEYPGTFTQQPKPHMRAAELSDNAFPEGEAQAGAHFMVPVEVSPHRHVPANLTPQESLELALDAAAATGRTRGELADTFRRAGLAAQAEGIDLRTEQQLQQREREVQEARDELDRIFGQSV